MLYEIYHNYLLFLCLMSCHNGRQSSCENVPVEKDSVQLRVIPVSISDTAYRNVDQTFEQISYVVLSDNVVIGEIGKHPIKYTL